MMFAVPGWSVSASSLKRQTEANVKKESAVPREHSRASRKRKRETKPTGPNGQPLGPRTDLADNGGDTGLSSFQTNSGGKKRSDVKHAAPIAPTPAVSSDPTTSPVTNGNAKSKSKSKHKRDKNGERRNLSDATATNRDEHRALPTTKPPPTPPAQPPKALTPLQQKMREKLISARFRHLNETLYTAPSSTSLSLFADNPTMFEDYHSGFRQQVAVWPENPVETFIASLTTRAAMRWPVRTGWQEQQRAKKKKNNKRSQDVPQEEAADGDEPYATTPLDPLPRQGPTCTIADLGCGDATLAQRLAASGVAKRCRLNVLSYDLAAPNEFVTKADVASLPLADGSVDVAIFCLALMGTNWLDFIDEAYRVLRWKGELWVAEIKSRFGRRGPREQGGKGAGGAVVEHSVGKRRKLGAVAGGKKDAAAWAREEEERHDEQLRTEVDGEAGKQETDVGAFVAALERRGFVLRKGEGSVDLRNKMFVRMDFIKTAPPRVGKNFKFEDAQKAKTKFVESGELVDPELEAKVLKPCLYKIR